VASAVDVGTVEVTGPTKLNTTGPGAATATQTITLEETTYGALTIANQSDVLDAYFRVVPSDNGTLTAVAVSTSGYTAGTSPAITACTAGTGADLGAYICKVTAESTAIVPTTSTISLAIDYMAKKTAAIGSTVDVSLDGNTGVEAGPISLANVGISTSATKGVVPDLTPGATEAQNIAKLTITEKFANAISTGSFRLIAPTGVTFNNVASVAATANAGALSGTVTITDTFAPSDTLVIPVAGTPTISFTAQAVIGPDVTEWVTFKVVDGDINGKNKTGITNEDVMLAYADGTLGDVDAGADAAVNVGFSISRTVEGGLVDYTVASNDTSIATVAVDGDSVTVTGKAAGVASVSVTDELGGSDSFNVTVSAGATQPAASKVVGASDASFSSGASADGGDSYAETFTTGDDVTLVGTVNVDPVHQGLDGAIHVAVLSVVDGTTSLVYLDEDSVFVEWDITAGLPGAHIVAEPLAASYSVTIFDGTLAAGSHRVALAYTTENGDLIYAPKALIIEVTE